MYIHITGARSRTCWSINNDTDAPDFYDANPGIEAPGTTLSYSRIAAVLQVDKDVYETFH